MRSDNIVYNKVIPQNVATFIKMGLKGQQTKQSDNRQVVNKPTFSPDVLNHFIWRSS